MRKVVSVLLVGMMIFLTGSVGFAANGKGDIAVPNYSTISDAQTLCDISSGKVTASITVYPLKNAGIDRVVATVHLMKKESGKAVKSWYSVELTGPDIINRFKFREEYQLTERGTYYTTATIYLYSGGKLKETIRNVNSLTDTY